MMRRAPSTPRSCGASWEAAPRRALRSTVGFRSTRAGESHANARHEEVQMVTESTRDATDGYVRMWHVYALEREDGS